MNELESVTKINDIWTQHLRYRKRSKFEEACIIFPPSVDKSGILISIIVSTHESLAPGYQSFRSLHCVELELTILRVLDCRQLLKIRSKAQLLGHI